MINRKWLKTSIFIPLYGGIINILILYIKTSKSKESRKKIYILIAMSAVLTVIFILVMFLFWTMVIMLFFGEKLELYRDLTMIISFIFAGYFLNFYVLKFYNQTYLSNNEQ